MPIFKYPEDLKIFFLKLFYVLFLKCQNKITVQSSNHVDYMSIQLVL